MTFRNYIVHKSNRTHAHPFTSPTPGYMLLKVLHLSSFDEEYQAMESFIKIIYGVPFCFKVS